LRTKYLSGCISASVGGVFLKHHTSHSQRLRYRRCEISCDQLIIRVFYLENNVHFRTYFLFCWRCVLKLHTSQSTRMRPKRCSFRSTCSLIKGILLGKGVQFRLYLGFHRRDFPEALRFAPSTHALRKVQVWSDHSIMEGNLIGKECIFSALSRLSLEGFSWSFYNHALQIFLFRFRLVTNEGHFTWRRNYLLAMFGLPFGRVFWNFTIRIFQACARKDGSMVAIGQ
jgi:hypothetical protein